jgi:Cu(I)/Ag(I) efflux system membrane protein CusA/SilA
MESKTEKEERIAIIEKASHQVGRAIFFSTLIIVVSFLPVFMLTGQEYKLFSPMAWTKTLVLACSAIFAITLVPVLMTYFIKGKLRPESKNPVSRFFDKLYEPVLHLALKWKKITIGLNVIALIIAVAVFMRMGSEFMPPLDEGSILFMPVTLPDVSNTEIRRILQVQDRIIKSVPEVANVLGKAGRAITATDNSPISMIETVILLKSKNTWRKGITKEDIVNELNHKLEIPGVTNGWTQPIINRINMLSTGIRTDVGVKIYGGNLDSIDVLSNKIKNELEGINGLKDLYVEPITGGKYLDIEINRNEIGRYGLSVDDVNMMVESALGGMPLTTTIEGRQRFNVNVRYAQDFRNSIDEIKRLQIQTKDYGIIPLSAVADVKYSEGPPMINSENALLRGTVLFNVRGRDLGSTVKEAMKKLDAMAKKLPKGYYVEWSGQWENQIHAQKSLTVILPITLILIFILLVIIYRSVKEAIITSISVPFALIGGVFMVYFYGVNLSMAVAVGFIALTGVAVETGVLMVIYLDEAMATMIKEKGTELITKKDIQNAVIAGAAKRLRPKLMTVATALFGLIPILFSTGTGTDLMVPIALPMIGGMFTSTIHVLLVTPIIFQLTKEYELKKHGKIEILKAKI